MANPSLQIGNEKWAIKEDNLLGYSTAGTRFVPQPITMTRGSAGTRVNPEGLVETVGLVVGTEFMLNPNFVTDTNWGGSYDINTVTQQLTKTGGGLAYQTTGGITTGTSYKVVVDVASLDGATTIWLAGNSYPLVVGVQTIYAVGGTNTGFDKVAVNSGYISTGSVINSISVKEAAIDDLARVDYDGSVSSLLVEPERTNKVTYSEDFSNAAWFKTSGVTLTSNYGVSPDGNNNSTRLQLSTNNEQIYASITHSGNTETASLYVKGTSGETIQFGVGANIAQGDAYTLNGEWQRITQQSTAGSIIIIGNKDLTATDFEIWGAQLEEGSYPTSYIPTDGTTVTRVQDLYSKTGISDLINSPEGTFFIDLALLTLNTNLSGQASISLSDGSSTNRLLLYTAPTVNANRISVQLANSTGMIWSKPVDLTDITLFNKIAITWKTGQYKIFLNGTSYWLNESYTEVPSGLNSLAFGAYGEANNPFYGKVKHLQVYKTALSDSELVTLTT